MHRGGPYGLPPRRAPFGRRAGQPSEGAPTRTARSPRTCNAARPHLAWLGKECTTPGPGKNQNTESCDPFHPGTARDGSESGTKLRIVAAEACGGVFGHTGTDRVGGYACPRLTLFATEWSAARKNPLRAAALHLSATISADVKARRILTSGRRKLPPAIFEARATLREQRESAVGRRIGKPQAVPVCPKTAPHASATPTPRGPSPFASKRRMSPFIRCLFGTFPLKLA
jgi:hypothetical protein